MFLACSLDVFADHPPDDALAAIRSVGLEFVEISLCPNTANSHPVVDESWASNWETLLARYEIAVALAGVSFAPLEAAATFSAAQRNLRIAHRLQASHAVVFAGVADEQDQAKRRLLCDQIHRLGDLADELEMVLCLDTRPGLCGDSRSMNKTMIEVNHPSVQLCFDTGAYRWCNSNSSEEVALQRILNHVGAIRLRDFEDCDDFEACSSEPYFPPLGLGGGVDFARMLQILRAVEFKGPCAISFSAKANGKRGSLDQVCEALDRSVVLLRDCGWLDS